MTTGIIVYVACPYTKGDKSENVRRCIKLCDELWAAGYVPFCPLLTHFWDLMSPKSYEEWLEYDKHWLRMCDAMLWDNQRCPGESNGAMQEELTAIRALIPVFYSLESLLAADPNKCFPL